MSACINFKVWLTDESTFPSSPTFQSKGQKKVVSLPKVYHKEKKAASFSIHRVISLDNRSNESTLIINKRVLIRSCIRTNKLSCRTKLGLKKKTFRGYLPFTKSLFHDILNIGFKMLLKWNTEVQTTSPKCMLLISCHLRCAANSAAVAVT